MYSLVHLGRESVWESFTGLTGDGVKITPVKLVRSFSKTRAKTITLTGITDVSCGCDYRYNWTSHWSI